MTNLILEKTDQVRMYTNMRDVFEAANIAPQDYDWYVSDIETNWRPPGFRPDDQWFTGDKLAAFLYAHEIQFIWAVFSAVPKGLRPIPAQAPIRRGQSTVLGWYGAGTAVGRRFVRNRLLGQQWNDSNQPTRPGYRFVREPISRRQAVGNRALLSDAARSALGRFRPFTANAGFFNLATCFVGLKG